LKLHLGHPARWLTQFGLGGTRRALALAALALCAAPAGAQTLPPPQNVVSLSASATAELPNDWLTLVLGTTREGSDAAVVQAQLKQALETTLVDARKLAKPGQVELRSGNFSLYPRYAPKGGISGWQGTVDLVVEGRDVAAITQLAGRAGALTVSRLGFSLSREAREKAEAEVTGQAINAFRAKAAATSQAFGFGGYTLREVTVGGDGPVVHNEAPMFRARAMVASAEAAPPVEAGKATVAVTVSGSVQMSPR
jgi:predicted secreted protein